MREDDRPNHGSNISPSNTGAGLPLGETLRRRISSANFPPLSPQTEGPSESDKHLSNAEIQEIATIVATVMKKEKRWYSGPLLFTSGVLVGVAASVAVDRVYGDEPIPEPTPASRDIGSGPTSFTDDSLIDDRLAPRAETTKVNPEEVFDNKAEKSKFSKNNIHFVDSQEVNQLSLKPVIDKDTQNITFTLPFKISENTTGTMERIDLADTDPNAQDPTQRPPVAIVDFKFDNVVSIVAPDDSHTYLIRGIQEWGQDPNLAGQVWFFKYYEEEDTTVAWRFTDNNPIKLGSFNNLLPMKDFEKNSLRGANYESLPLVDALTEVMTTTEPNQPVRLSVMAYKGKIAGSEAAIVGDDFLLKPNFFTESSNAAEKLLALKK